MSITANNKIIGDVYFSSTKIGEIYKGNTLIYESIQDTSTPIPMYAYRHTNSNANVYVIGSQNTSGLLVLPTSYGITKIKTITGTLGTSGSKITIKDISVTFTYSQTFNFNGINLCSYTYSYYTVFVRSDSSINSQALRYAYPSRIALHPYICDSTKLYPREEDYTYNMQYLYTNEIYSFGATKINAPL